MLQPAFFIAARILNPSTTTLAIFCKVVDNYGDIGICWRLARQLRAEHGVAVTLWVDDLASFRRICHEVDPAAASQRIDGVEVRHWAGQDGEFTPDDVADIVIEFFAVDIPPGYVAAMAQRTPRPVWFNLEGLSAEEWVEGCHSLPSPHPSLPLTKHFFFPGYTERTGGLLLEAGLITQREAFQADRGAVAEFLARFGVTQAEMAATKVSLFCYPHAPVAELFAAWEQGDAPVVCLVPEGVAADAVQDFFAADAAPDDAGAVAASAAPVAARAGAAHTRGALTVRVLPFVPQPDYDKLLWACDLNFVRGEDSWVRAQWARRPFVWHIYPQDENLHHKKLRAFLDRYVVAQPELAPLSAFSLCWNGASDAEQQGGWPALWSALQTAAPALATRAADWQRQVLAHGDLASNLLAFARSLQLAASKN